MAAPWQAPQSARREDDGQHRGHAQREERPYEEEGLGGLAVHMKGASGVVGGFAAELLYRLDPEQGSVLFFREHVKQAVRTLAYIADSLP